MEIKNLELQTERGLRDAQTEFDDYLENLYEGGIGNILYLRKMCRNLIDDLEDLFDEDSSSQKYGEALKRYIKQNYGRL